MDHTLQHKARIVTKWLDENKDYIKMLWLPGTPEITEMEWFWGKANPY